MNRIYIIILLFYVGIASGQVHTEDSTAVDRPKVGLVLSGGSAHGLAHIGVIQLLEEIDMPIDYITGTSMGSIIGSLKAMGYDSDRIRHIADQMEWDDIIGDVTYLNDISPTEKYYHDKYPLKLKITADGVKLPLGLVASNKIDLTLSKLYAPAYKITNFDQLRIPFKCYAVDIAAGEVYTIESGSLSTGIRASMAIPTLFPPVRLEDKLLIDGGLMRNFPAEEAKMMGADIIIGSYVGAQKQNLEDMKSFVQIMRQSGFLLAHMDYERQLEYVDVLLKPDVKDYNSLDFDYADLYIEEGYLEALRKKKKLLEIMKEHSLKGTNIPIKPLPNLDFLYVNEIKMSEQSKALKELILDKLEIQPGTYTTITSIEDGIRRAYATKAFHKISYNLIEEEGRTILNIKSEAVKQASLGANVNTYYSTGSAIIINAAVKNYLNGISDFRLTGRLAEYPGFALETSTRGGLGTRNFVYGIKMKSEKYKFPIYIDNRKIYEYSIVDLNFRPDVVWEYSSSISFKGYYNFKYHLLNNLIENDQRLDWYKLNTQSVGGDIEFNNLDNQVNPRSGLHIKLSTEYNFQVDNKYKYITGFEPESDYSDIEKIWSANFYLRHVFKVFKSLKASYTTNSHFTTAYTLTNNFFIGGTYQNKRHYLPFTGLREGEGIYGNHFYARTELIKQINEDIFLKAAANFVIGEKPIHTLITEVNDVDYDFGYGLGILIDLPTGPLQFDLGFNNEDLYFKPSLSIGYRHMW